MIYIEPMGLSQNLVEMFSDTINDLDYPTSVKMDARRALNVGKEGIK